MRYAAAAVALTLAIDDIRREQCGRRRHRSTRHTKRSARASARQAVATPRVPILRALHLG
jgi:hypothetical protein